MSQPNGSLTRDFFRQKAQPVTVTVGGVPLIAEVKEFSTGSLGWYCGGKLTLNVDGQQVRVQVGVTLTVIGSKEIPR